MHRCFMKTRTTSLLRGIAVMLVGVAVLFVSARFASPKVVEYVGYAAGMTILYIGFAVAFRTTRHSPS